MGKKSAISEVLSKLNSQQRKAATHGAGELKELFDGYLDRKETGAASLDVDDGFESEMTSRKVRRRTKNLWS